MTAALIWFRRDLRLADNPALARAVEVAETIIPVYIHNPAHGGEWSMGRASQWWLHHSLESLDGALRRLGSRLVVRHGDEQQALRQLIAETGAAWVFWNRLYDPADISRDTRIKQALRAEDSVGVETFNGSLIREPWQVSRDDGGGYRVFTPFWKAMQKQGLKHIPLAAPVALPPVSGDLRAVPVDTLGLLPRIPWDVGFRQAWAVGEDAAQARLAAFAESALPDYRQARDRPDVPGTSRLSPHLHFGEISPGQIVASLEGMGLDMPCGVGADAYLREVGWREFAYHLLFHFPHTPDEALDTRFADFPWGSGYEASLAAWQQGRTGFPIIDRACVNSGRRAGCITGSG